eukprot:gene1985-5065_t
MSLPSLLLLTLLQLLCCERTCARNLEWFGGDMNFINTDNWEGKVPVDGHDTSFVDMRSEMPFTSYIEGETYNFGHTLKLPANGKLLFQADQPVIIKFRYMTSQGFKLS